MRTRSTTCLLLLAFAGCGGAPTVTTDAPAPTDYSTESCGAPTLSTWSVSTATAGPPFVGFGAEFNQNLYAALSRSAGITSADVARLEPKLTSLAPAHVRVFFDSNALHDPDLLQSFVETVALAERSGATVNVTYWHGPYPDPAKQMQEFANVLADLKTTRNLAAVRYVTIQNEVNSTKVTMAEYEQLYRLLDKDLRAAGLRQDIQLVGGDLLLQGQEAWLQYLGAHLSDVLDGYSVHIYWDFTDTAKLVSRLQGVRQIVDALPAKQRKPLYVTEFGVEGTRAAGEPAPGHLADGTPVEKSPAAALENAWFDLLAARLGFVATLRWDAYFAMYDHTPQAFSLIGAPQQGWPLRPSYHLLRLLTHTVEPGWRAHVVNGSSSDGLVTAFEGAGQTTALVMNRDACPRAFHLTGLPASRSFYFIVWNGDGHGTLAARARPKSSAAGELTVTAPPRSVIALSTQLPGLGL